MSYAEKMTEMVEMGKVFQDFTCLTELWLENLLIKISSLILGLSQQSNDC